MPAYMIGEIDLTDTGGYEAYRAGVPATIAQYGGRYVVRGGATELLEGGPQPKRIVVLEFADAEALKRWYNSPEYQKLLPARLKSSKGRIMMVDGVK